MLVNKIQGVFVKARERCRGLTSEQHHHDGVELLGVGVRGDIAEADGYEGGEAKVERGAVARLQ